jgi:hypothetical protein
VIAIEVDHDVDPIDLIFEIPLYALARARHRRRLRIPKSHGQTRGCRQNPSLGPQRGGFTVERLYLTEIGDVASFAPFLGVDAAVDLDRRGRRCQRRKQQQCQVRV